MQSPVKIWRNQQKLARLHGKRGSVISWTLIRVPPGDFMDQAPYPVVLVELLDKKRIEAQLVDAKPELVAFGMKVRMIVRRVTHPDADGVITYGIKAKPI